MPRMTDDELAAKLEALPVDDAHALCAVEMYRARRAEETYLKSHELLCMMFIIEMPSMMQLNKSLGIDTQYIATMHGHYRVKAQTMEDATALAVSAEREACAGVAEEHADSRESVRYPDISEDAAKYATATAMAVADDIRKRGEG